MSPTVDVQALTIVDGSGRPVLHGTTLTAATGQVTALVGPSGAGKTTLLHSLVGALPAAFHRRAGAIRVLGHDPFALATPALRDLRRTRISLVGQDPAARLNPRMPVRRLIRECATDRDPASIAAILRAVDLPSTRDFLRRRPGELSGGQVRRVALARAIARRPDLLLLDEPTAGLDGPLRAEIGNLLRELATDQGLTIVLACHDLDLVDQIADGVVPLPSLHSTPATPPSIHSTPATPPTLRPPAADAPTVPGEVDADEVAPGKAVRGEAAPGKAAPGEVIPGEVIPGEVIPGEVIPGEVIPGEVVPPPDHRTPPARPPDRHTGSATPLARRPLTADASVILAAERLSAYAGRRGQPILRDVGLELGRGTALAVVGPSGAGKTTLARVITGLHRAASGTLTFDGQPLALTAARRGRAQSRRIQLVPQHPLGALNPVRTVGATLARPLRLHRRCRRDQVPARIRELLAAVQLPAELASRYPHELSGGQRQRVSLARALATEPDLLVCDEITSALDAGTTEAIMRLLTQLRVDHGLSLLIISHDLPLVDAYCDTAITLAPLP
ncbi:ATP-binding cassette domain-containing protein [Actinomycetes bacterium KLBMP 9797]